MVLDGGGPTIRLHSCSELLYLSTCQQKVNSEEAKATRPPGGQTTYKTGESMGRVGLNRECGSRHFSTDSTADKLERTTRYKQRLKSRYQSFVFSNKSRCDRAPGARVLNLACAVSVTVIYQLQAAPQVLGSHFRQLLWPACVDMSLPLSPSRLMAD